MATPAAILTMLVKVQGAQAAAGQLSGLDKNARRAGAGLKATESSAKRSSRSFAAVGGAAKLAGIGLGAAGLAKGLSSAVSEYREAQKVGGQTTAVLKSTAGAAKVSAKEVQNLAAAISRKTGIDDEQIQASENMLLTFTKLRNETGKGNDIFSQATQTVTDMSVALGQSGKSSAIQLGKALNDPIKGITALRRVGVAFTADQQKQIETMVKSGDLLGAQKAILKELNTEFAGSAAAQATAGDKFKVAMGNLAEAAGAILVPQIDKAARVLTTLMNQMVQGVGVGGSLVSVFRTTGGVIGSVVGTVASLVNGFRNGNTGAIALGATVGGLAAGFVTYRTAVAASTAATKIHTAWTTRAAIQQRVLNLAMRANPIGLVITALVALGVGLTIAYNKSETFRAIVDAVARTLRNGLLGALSAVLGGLSSFLSAIASAARAVGADGLANKAQAGANAIDRLRTSLNNAKDKSTEATRNLDRFKRSIDELPDRKSVNIVANVSVKESQQNKADQFNDFGKSRGDGPGQAVRRAVGGGVQRVANKAARNFIPGIGALPSGKGAGSLMGAGKHMAPFAAIGARYGLRVSSGLRPGAVTSSGRPSHHASGNAVDLAGSPAGMMQAFRVLQGHAGQLAELIYTPGGAYSNGQRYTPTGQLAKDHYDHIHVAYKGGSGDGLGEGRIAGAAKGVGSNILALAQKVWALQAPMMGRGGASMPSFKVGNVGKSWATADSAANRVTLSSSLKTALQPGATNRADALKALVHEFVHIGQRFARTKNETEGGAESFAQAHFHDIARRLGIDVGSAWLAYPKETAWVGKNRGSNWIERRQFVGPEWGRAAGAVKNASPKPGQGGGQAAVIAAAAKRHGIDPAILWGLFGAESNFGKNLGPSSAGARGPFQFMPQTAKAYGIDPMDFKAAANAAAKYLATYKERGTAGMLLAYNAGPAGKMNPESAAYIPKVKKLAKTWPGAKGTAGSTTSSTAAERVNPLDQKLANADVAIEQAKRGTIKVGNRKISSALQQVAALTGKRQVIGKRIRSIRKALKGKLSGAKRLALTQELSQRLGEHAQLGTDVKALRNPAADATTDLGAGAAGDLGGGADPNQPLIDALAAAAEVERERIEAAKAHTEALNGVRAEVKRASDIANAVQSTEAFQIKKYLADVLSGEVVGRGVIGRSFTPGYGVEASY